MENKIPTDQKAELEVIGAMLNSERCFHEAVSLVDQTFFHYNVSQVVFKTMMELSSEAVPKVNDVLKKIDDPKAKAFIHQADQTYNSSVSFKHSLNALTTTYVKRQYFYTANKLLGMTQDKQTTSGDLSDALEQSISSIHFEESKEDIISPKEYATEGYEEFYKRFENPESAYGIRLSYELRNGVVVGFPSLDKTFMGLRGGDLILIGAKTGDGKTALAQNLSRIISVHQHYTTYYENTEMTISEMRERLVSQLTQIPATEIMTGQLEGTKEEINIKLERISNGFNTLLKSNLYLSRIPYLTPQRSRGLARRMKLKYGKLDCLVIDYIGRMELDNQQGMQEWQVLYQIAKESKRLAVELDIPVIILSQLTEEGKVEGARKIKNECDGVLFFERATEEDEEWIKRDIWDERQRRQVNYKIVKEKVRRNDNEKPIWCAFDKKILFVNEVS